MESKTVWRSLFLTEDVNFEGDPFVSCISFSVYGGIIGNSYACNQVSNEHAADSTTDFAGTLSKALSLLTVPLSITVLAFSETILDNEAEAPSTERALCSSKKVVFSLTSSENGLSAVSSIMLASLDSTPITKRKT